MAQRAPQIAWMPDLCRLPRLGAMLGLAELVVLVVTLVPDAGARNITLSRFLSASGLALWLALAVTVLLCVLRPTLSRLPPRLGGLSALLIAAVVAMLGAGIVHGLY
ncbi:sensor histidine kinase, partial [Xanthomonas perforans]|nr:sensor histidine kinase [Xanthomonas perforans]